MKTLLNRSAIVILSAILIGPYPAYAQNFAGTGKKTAAAVQPSQSLSKPAQTENFKTTEDTSAREITSEAVTRQDMTHKRYAGSSNSRYTLGPNDVVEVTVARHPEVGGRYTINNEGKIQFEFLGDVQLSGLTKEETAQNLTKRLETYIIKPEVTVKILEYNSKVVYIVGEVGAPGKIFMRGDTITVREALLNAGLPQLTAATTAATLFTPAADGHVASKRVNVYELLYKGDLRENYIMKPGDSLYLPPTLWAKVARFLNPVTQPLGQAAGAAASVGAL